MNCTLCGHVAEALAQDHLRRSFDCGGCGLIFADPASHLDVAAEKREYDRHQNDPADPRYRAFLNKLAEPLLARLTPDPRNMAGLDYGCGPGPALAMMLEEAGMRMAVYDPLYAPDRSVLDRTYDFVTCTEVVEHFRQPAEEWAQLIRLVQFRGGWLGVMTQRVISRERFIQWNYKNDPTHVSFYRDRTFEWLGDHFGFEVEFVGSDVVLMRKG